MLWCLPPSILQVGSCLHTSIHLNIYIYLCIGSGDGAGREEGFEEDNLADVMVELGQELEDDDQEEEEDDHPGNDDQGETGFMDSFREEEVEEEEEDEEGGSGEEEEEDEDLAAAAGGLWGLAQSQRSNKHLRLDHTAEHIDTHVSTKRVDTHMSTNRVDTHVSAKRVSTVSSDAKIVRGSGSILQLQHNSNLAQNQGSKSVDSVYDTEARLGQHPASGLGDHQLLVKKTPVKSTRRKVNRKLHSSGASGGGSGLKRKGYTVTGKARWHEDYNVSLSTPSHKHNRRVCVFFYYQWLCALLIMYLVCSLILR